MTDTSKKDTQLKNNTVKMEDTAVGVATDSVINDTNNDESQENQSTFSGKYYYGVGRRKTAVAQVRLYDDPKGRVIINGRELNDYFKKDALRNKVTEPLRTVGLDKDFGISIIVLGGGINGQADSCCLGVARAVLKYSSDYRPTLKPSGLLTRDSRKKERKKPGLKRARRAPQWSKR